MYTYFIAIFNIIFNTIPILLANTNPLPSFHELSIIFRLINSSFIFFI